VVENKNIFGLKKVTQVSNMLVKWLLRTLIYKQSGRIAGLYWRLRNEIDGQDVVDVGQLHDLNVRAD
jgi:hypothetical protein